MRLFSVRGALPNRCVIRRCAVIIAACACAVTTLHAQRAPRIGYVYPAGGQRGASFDVVVGGQYLEDPTGVLVSGDGIDVRIIEHDKPPPNIVIDEIRAKFRDLQPKLRGLRDGPALPPGEILPAIRRLLRETKLTEKELRQMADFDRKRNDPKQQQNVQISEMVRIRVNIAPDAEPGLRQWRLRTGNGLSNPMRFAVGQHPEVHEVERPLEFDIGFQSGGDPTATQSKEPITQPVVTTLPATINGRILPGEVDRFTFHAKKGEQLVMVVQARNLVPYLADAVPGWFQAVVAVRDSSGREIAFADGYRFDPDPVAFYRIPDDGQYQIEVHDSIYRGREDFVYRITLGELPFITGMAPLGAPAGSDVEIKFLGGNLGTANTLKFKAPAQPTITALFADRDGWRSNLIPFHVDNLPEEAEREPNNSFGGAHEVKPPVIVNGRIDSPGEADIFRLKGRGNKDMVFEIFARRLGSPLDATLTAFDSNGKQLAVNDDHEDPASGLTTHHADSRLVVKLPDSGECFVRVSDTQNQASITHAYRLRVTQAAPRFALRVTPSSLNARPGGTARFTVHALRLDGFDGEIALQLHNGPDGFRLNNATVPAKADTAEVSLTVPSTPTEKPVAISIQGTAEVDNHKLVVDAVPAEDMMQAFIYRHLVPVDELLVDVHTPPERPAQ